MFYFLRGQATFIVDPKDVPKLFQKDFDSTQILHARANGDNLSETLFCNSVCLFVGAFIQCPGFKMFAVVIT